MTKKQKEERVENPSLFNTFLIFGVLPIAVFVIFALLDRHQFGFLDGWRLDIRQPIASNNEKASRPVVTDNIVKAPLDDISSSDGIEIDDDKIYETLREAEALLARDEQINDGGTVQSKSIATFSKAIQKLQTKRNLLLQKGVDIKRNKAGDVLFIDDELHLPLETRSIQGLLFGALCSLGRQYHMANMFQMSEQTYNNALQLEPDSQFALRLRASVRVILGKYDEVGQDYISILDNKQNALDAKILSNVATLLKAKEDAIPNGWERVRNGLVELIPKYTEKFADILKLGQDTDEAKYTAALLLDQLKQLYYAQFIYHDRHTGNVESAFKSLQMSHQYRLAALPGFNFEQEKTRIDTVKQIFRKGFWPDNVGIDSKKLVFIIGFPRSGSTLLERILDAHHEIVGTGEDSVFNGMLPQIRDAIVKASMAGSSDIVHKTVLKFATEVEEHTEKRWAEIEERENGENFKRIKPLRFVDKMLMNYSNVGFIHLLYPNALILHVVREPMDTLYSCYEHEFPPPGNLQYTADFEALSQLYRGYRDLMDHWDQELPGRVTHIRYEDIVNNTEEISKAIIRAVGLEWDDSILNFHKTNYKVNTHSTAQVNKPIYKSSMKRWKKYKEGLAPLKTSLGTMYTTHTFKTNLPGYN